jgi:hypothetical protein
MDCVQTTIHPKRGVLIPQYVFQVQTWSDRDIQRSSASASPPHDGGWNSVSPSNKKDLPSTRPRPGGCNLPISPQCDTNPAKRDTKAPSRRQKSKNLIVGGAGAGVRVPGNGPGSLHFALNRWGAKRPDDRSLAGWIIQPVGLQLSGNQAPLCTKMLHWHPRTGSPPTSSRRTDMVKDLKLRQAGGSVSATLPKDMVDRAWGPG